MSFSSEKFWQGTTAAKPGFAGAAPGISTAASVREKKDKPLVPFWVKALAGAGPFIVVSFAVFFFWLGTLLGKASGGGSGGSAGAAGSQGAGTDQQQIQELLNRALGALQQELLRETKTVRESSDRIQMKLEDVTKRLNDRVSQLETFSKEAGGQLKRVLGKLRSRGRVFIWFVHSERSPFGRYHSVWEELPQWVAKKQGLFVKFFVQENETVIAKWDSESRSPLQKAQTPAAHARQTIAIDLLVRELKAANESPYWAAWLPLSVVICAPIQGFGDLEGQNLGKLEQVIHELGVDELWLVPMITRGEESPKGSSQLKLDLALVPRVSASTRGDLLRTLVYPLFLPTGAQGSDVAEDIEQLRRLLLGLGLGEEKAQQ